MNGPVPEKRAFVCRGEEGAEDDQSGPVWRSRWTAEHVRTAGKWLIFASIPRQDGTDAVATGRYRPGISSPADYQAVSLGVAPEPVPEADLHVHNEWSWDAPRGAMAATCRQAQEQGLLRSCSWSRS